MNSTFLALLLFVSPVFAQEAEPKWSPPTEFHAQSACPISGEELEDRDHFVDYEGHRTFLCCEKCVKKFTATPDAHLYAMYLDGIEPLNLQTVCPVTAKELKNREHSMRILNRTIYFLTAKAALVGAKDPVAMLDTIAGRHPQELCAVMGGKVDPKGIFEVAGQTVRYCCPGCSDDFQAEPAEFFAILEERNAVLEPSSANCLVHPKKPITSRMWFVTLGARRYFFHDAEAQREFFAEPERWLPKLPTAEAVTKSN